MRPSQVRICTFPRSLSSEDVESLLGRVSRLTEVLVNLPYINTPKDVYERERCLLHIKEYARLLRTTYQLRYVPNTSTFDDHDQVASMLVFLFARFERLRQSDGVDQGTSLLSSLRSRLGQQNHHAANAFSEAFPTGGEWQPGRYDSRYDIGIVTVLEHEYQSVVRRMQRVEQCTNDKSFGFAILDRARSTQDLKDCSSGGHALGWMLGCIGPTRVLVLCTGQKGKDNTAAALSKAVQIFGVPSIGWVVAGVCAGSNDRWPIGTVLISKTSVFDVTRTHSHIFDVENVVSPIELTTPIPRRMATKLMFRRPPKGSPQNPAVASSNQIPQHGVKFACTNEVINERKDRESLLQQLVERGLLGSNEHMGIEMEGAGVAGFGEAPVCIVKSVCDYADGRKNKWSKAKKVLFQLYAAETAAECISRLVPRLVKQQSTHRRALADNVPTRAPTPAQSTS